MQITVNETGARTIAEARPMRIDGQNVYVVVSENEAALMVAGRIVEVKSPEGMNITEAQTWAVEYRKGLADEDTVAEAVNPEAVYAGAVESVRDAGEMIAKQAGKLAATATDAPYRFRNSRGRSVTVNRNDPRHPLNACKTLLNRAQIMMAWTVADEISYTRYVDDGISATDGYYAPLDRDAWKSTQTA